MRLRLTRQLSAAVLFGALTAAMPALAAETPAGLDGQEQGRYLAELKSLYLTANERQALLAHCNDLLKTYALKAGYQVGQPQRQDRTYQLALGEPGELLVREELRAEQGNERKVSNQRLSVFGLDPFIRYECPPVGNSCVLHNPADGSPWVSILRDHKGAAELAKAMSFLIRNLQKN
ncbi:MAG: hypothetical protein ABWY06_05980 [Pseudomonas sp.]|uniref:hypothetical protein n=1 Tax=Pseudomonas sp. TaxID=306 RepID=UPI003396F524